MTATPELSCEGKVKHGSRLDALHRLKTQRQGGRLRNKRRKGAKVIPYKCVYCGMWHVGNNTKKSYDTLTSKLRRLL